MTPGQKQMVAIRDLIRTEIRAYATKDYVAVRGMHMRDAEVAFDQLCEAFGHEVPAE